MIWSVSSSLSRVRVRVHVVTAPLLTLAQSLSRALGRRFLLLLLPFSPFLLGSDKSKYPILIRVRIHEGRVKEAPRNSADLARLRVRFEGAVVHRRQLRRGSRQPAVAGRDGEAAQVDHDLQGPPLRRRRGAHPRARGDQHLPRDRRGQRRHPLARRRPRRRVQLARGQRAPLRPGVDHIRRRRRQRGRRVRGRLPYRRAPPRPAEPPRRRRRGRGRGRRHQVLHRQHHGRARAVRSTVHRRLPPGHRVAAAANPGLPEQDQRALHDQPLPLLRVPGRPPAGDAGLLPVPVQCRPRRRRVEDQVHQHVRRAARRRQVGAGAHRVRRRGDRGGGDRVADEGRRRGGRCHGGQRQGVRRQPGRSPAVGRRHAADAWQVGGHVPVRALRRGPEARADVGAVVRAVPHRPHHGLRRRADVVRQRGELEQRRRGRGAADGGRVVRGEGRRDGRRAADRPGLRVRAGGRGLHRHPGRGRVLRAQHGARPRLVRHEPALPGRRPPPLELRLPAVRHAHLRQPQLRLMCLHRGPIMPRTTNPDTIPWRIILFCMYNDNKFGGYKRLCEWNKATNNSCGGSL